MTGMARIAASRAERFARVEIAAALFGVVERQQDLPGDDAVGVQRVRPGPRQRDLADRRRSLAILELQLAARGAFRSSARAQSRRRTRRAHRRRAHAEAAMSATSASSHSPFSAPRAGIDQQRRADLDDNAREFVEAWRSGHGRRDHESKGGRALEEGASFGKQSSAARSLLQPRSLTADSSVCGKPAKQGAYARLGSATPATKEA